MTILKRTLPKSVSTTLLVLMIILVMGLGAYAYIQQQEIKFLELKLEKNYQIQDAAIKIMRREKILDKVLEELLETDLTNEQIEYLNELKEIDPKKTTD